MKTARKLLAMAATLLAAVACDTPVDVPNKPIETEGKLFKITATTADFSRATDTAFEEGDALSVFAYKGSIVLPESPTPDDIVSALTGFSAWIDNAKFTKGDGGFAGDKEYKWYEGEEKSQIFGLYPYDEKWTTAELLVKGLTFCVQSDQTTHAGYTASDLMYATASDVAPTDESVKLAFGHLLSKIVVDVKNERTDRIVAAYVDGVQGNFLFEFPQYSATGDRGTIRAGELATPSEGCTNSFVLIVPPQEATPKLAFVTETGEQLTFENTESAIKFGAGKVRHLTVTITPKSISAEFDAIVNDWSADPDVEFKDQPSSGEDEGGEGEQQEMVFTVWGSDGSLSEAFTPSEENLYEVSLLVENTDVGYSLKGVTPEGKELSFGGRLITTIYPVEMQEGSEEQIFFPFIGAYKLRLNTADMTLDITPWITMGGQYTYLGQGCISENWLMGVNWEADVMYDMNGSYLYVTPFGDLLQYVAQGNMPSFKPSENATPSAYVMVNTAETKFNGFPYISVNAMSPSSKDIYTGLMYEYEGVWYDLILQPASTVPIVPYNRVVGDGLMQTAMRYGLAGLGSFSGSDAINQTFTYMLPGATMENATYNLVGISYAGLDDYSQCCFSIYIERDADTFGIIPIDKEITDDELEGLISANLDKALVYNYSHSAENRDEWAMVVWTPEQTGRYGMIILGINAENRVVSRNYCNYTYTKPGEAGLPCEVTFEAEKDSMRPEDQIVVKIKGVNITSAYYSCLPNKAEYASLTDSELQAKCEEYGYNYLTGYLEFVNGGGYSEVFTNLQPSTEYLIVGWFANDFGNTTLMRRTVTTDAPAQWTSLGIGRYQDASHLFGQSESNRSAVEILQDSDGSAHYRIVKPYAGYWSRYSEGYIGHCGDYLELAVYPLSNAAGDVAYHVCYDLHSTGLQLDGSEVFLEHPYNSYTNALKYPMRDMGADAYLSSSNNMQGAIRLAPWYMIGDTGRGYNYSSGDAPITIVLPWEGSDQLTDEEIAPVTRAAISVPHRVAPIVKPTDKGGVVVKGGTHSHLARGRMGGMYRLPAADEFPLQ